jgi:hypothetical protein
MMYDQGDLDLARDAVRGILRAPQTERGALMASKLVHEWAKAEEDHELEREKMNKPQEINMNVRTPEPIDIRILSVDDAPRQAKL